MMEAGGAMSVKCPFDKPPKNLLINFSQSVILFKVLKRKVRSGCCSHLQRGQQHRFILTQRHEKQIIDYKVKAAYTLLLRHNVILTVYLNLKRFIREYLSNRVDNAEFIIYIN